MKTKRRFKQIAFVLVASLLLSVLPIGHVHEVKADVSGYGCGLYVHCGIGPNLATCVLCGQPSTWSIGNHTSNNVWVATDDSYCHTNCGICNGTMTTTAHDFGSNYVSGSSIYHKCSRCSRAVYVSPATYTISFNANGGSGSMKNQTFTMGVTGYLNSCTFTRTGHSFAGWNTASNASGTWYWERGSINRTSGATLFAIWSPNSYQVTFYTNSADTPDSTKNVTYNSTYGTLPTPVKTGYTFAGWFTEGGIQVTADTKMTTAGPVALYAKWTPNTYYIKYHVNSGDTVDGVAQESVTKSVTYECPVDLSVKATKDKYNHIGWALSSDSSFIIESFDSFKFETDEHYENYMTDNGTTLNLYAMYSPEVSDVWKCELAIWNISDKEGTYAKYDMTRTSAEDGGYIYKLSGDVTSKLKNTESSDIDYAVHMTDNAKNENTIGIDDLTEYYKVTVIHKPYSIDREKYEEFNREYYYIEENTSFTPSYIDELLLWHNPETNVSEITVTGEKTIEILYYPKGIPVTLDACGGSCEESSITVYMNTKYPTLPSAEKEGHTFAGWYTQPDKQGQKVLSSNIYPYPNTYPNGGPTTLYAGWNVDTHDVHYDFEYNGGQRMDEVALEDLTVEYGQPVNLTYQAYKEGWEFLGWTQVNDENDDASRTPEDELKMGTKNITLYPVFRKQVDFTFVDLLHPVDNPRTDFDVLYNEDGPGSVTSPVIEETDDWLPVGWTRYDDASGGIEVGNGNVCMSEDDVTYYAVYDREITVEYETNHPEVDDIDENGVVVYNCCGTSTPYETVTKVLPAQANHTFMHWDLNGTIYPERYTLELIEDSHFVAIWDQYPTLIVEERYFTLEQANNGVITEAELLKGAKATDREDDAAGIPVPITLEGFYPEEFVKLTNDADIAVTYVATDSIGNTVRRSILIHVVKSEVEEDTKVMATRFIEKEYFNTTDPNVYVDESNGGLRNASIWKNEEAYSSLLTYALSNEKTGMEYRDVTIGNSTTPLAVPSSGTWSHSYASHYYTYDEIQEIKAYVEEYGFAKYKNSDGTKRYIERFMTQ